MYSIKKMSLLTLSILFIISHLNTPVTYAKRALPDDSLILPVLVIREIGTGSGFYVNAKKYTFFVTARHVLFEESKIEERIDYSLKSKSVKLLSYPKNHKDQGRIILDLDLETLNNSGNIKYHKDHDVAVVCIALIESKKEGRMSLKMINGVRFKENPGSGSIGGVSMDTMTKFDSVLISNDVFIFGYPTSIGIQNIPQIEYDRPLLRKGIVAGKNKTEQTIILDCPIYPGNSGGPVLEVNPATLTKTEYKVIGILSQFIPFAEVWKNKTHGYTNLEISNSGYSVATPMDPVLNLISDFEGDDHNKE